MCILEHPAPENLGIPQVYSLSTPPPLPSPAPTSLTAEFHNRGRQSPGLRAGETTHTRTQDTHAGVLAVHRVFLFSICTWLPLVGCGAHLRSKRSNKGVDAVGGVNGENQRKAVAYILELSLFWC